MGAIWAMLATVIISLVSLTALTNTLQHQKALIQQRAAQYLLPAENAAKQLAQVQLNADVQAAQPTTYVLTSSTPAPACGSTTLPDGSACPFNVVTHASLSGASGTTASSSGNDTCNNANAAIGETCESFNFTTTVTNASSGAVVASRSSLITYRLITNPVPGFSGPYAYIAGQASTGATLNGAEANVGGCDPSAPTTSACGTNNGVSALDTVNHSYSQCQDGLISCTGVPSAQQYVETTTKQNEQYNSTNQSSGAWSH